MVRRIFAGLFLALLCLLSSAWAEGKFYLEVSPRSGSVDDVFVLSVVIEDTQTASAPYLIGGDDFKLTLIGPSNEVKIINGVVESRRSYQYELHPKREGTLETPSAEININGKKYAAPALKINVSKSAAATGSDEAFLRQSLNKETAYVGEQLSNTLEVYSAVNMLDPQLKDAAYDDFLMSQLGDEDRAQRVIDGTRYTITRLQYALFPLKEGKIELPPRELTARIPVTQKRRMPFGGMDPFDDDFLGSMFSTREYKPRTLRSNSTELTVLPLPEPRPSGLEEWRLPRAIVGKTSIACTGDTNAIKVGESKTITFEVTSNGNLNPLQHVPLDFGSAMRLYPENPEVKTIDNGAMLIAKKVFRLSMVPLQPGTVKIPRLRLPYFDPDTGKYQIAQSAAMSFEVTGPPIATPAAGGAGSSSSPENVIQPPTARPEGLPTWAPPGALERLSEQVSAGFALLLTAAIILLGLLISIAARIVRSSKSRKATLSAIKKAGSFEALRVAFESHLVTVLKLPLDSSGEPLKALVKSRVMDIDLRFSILTLLDEFDRLRYGKAAELPDLAALKGRALEAAQRSLR